MSLIFRKLVGESLFRGQYFNWTLGSQACLQNSFHSILSPLTGQGPSANGSTEGNIASTPWSLVSVRTKIRNNWPRPCEKKRQQMNFWNRMKTPGGRAVIMRRYLKGRHVLSH